MFCVCPCVSSPVPVSPCVFPSVSRCPARSGFSLPFPFHGCVAAHSHAPFPCDNAASSSRERVSPSCLWSAGFSSSPGLVRPPLLLCALPLRFDALPFFPSPFHLPFGAPSACRLVGIGERVGLRRVSCGFALGGWIVAAEGEEKREAGGRKEKEKTGKGEKCLPCRLAAGGSGSSAVLASLPWARLSLWFVWLSAAGRRRMRRPLLVRPPRWSALVALQWSCSCCVLRAGGVIGGFAVIAAVSFAVCASRGSAAASVTAATLSSSSSSRTRTSP